jgi:hypothetical protein
MGGWVSELITAQAGRLAHLLKILVKGKKMFEKTRCLTTVLDNDGTSKLESIKVVTAFSPYEKFPHFQVQELFYADNSPLSVLTRHLDQRSDNAAHMLDVHSEYAHNLELT